MKPSLGVATAHSPERFINYFVVGVLPAMIGKLTAENRLVIIVAPPVLLSPDTIFLAGLATVTVLLVGLNRTVRSQLTESITRLSGSGFPPVTVAIGK